MLSYHIIYKSIYIVDNVLFVWICVKVSFFFFLFCNFLMSWFLTLLFFVIFPLIVSKNVLRFLEQNTVKERWDGNHAYM